MRILFNQDKKGLYLVACSGGPDSMALLDLLYHQHFNILVALVNYKKRLESDEEEAMVKAYCMKRNIPFYSTEFQVNYEKKSFQAVAREFRYDFFSKLYHEFHCDGLFVAHHKDDVIETYLLKKQRNVINLSYLIESETNIKNMKVYRPLLHCYKEELLQYCKANEVEYRVDKSNFLPIYPRNIIRKQIQNLDKNAIYQQALDDEATLKHKQEEVLNYLNNHSMPYRLDDLKQKDPLFLQYFLYFAVDPMYRHAINNNQVSNLIKIFGSKKPNLKHKIEKNYYMIKAYDNLVFKEIESARTYCYLLNDFEYFDTSYFKTTSTGAKMQGIYLEKSDFPIKIRNIKVGDVVDLAQGHKKINRLLIDKKIPIDRRKMMPIIENAQGKIIYVSENYRYFTRKTTQNNFFVIEYKK